MASKRYQVPGNKMNKRHERSLYRDNYRLNTIPTPTGGIQQGYSKMVMKMQSVKKSQGILQEKQGSRFVLLVIKFQD